MDLGGGGRRAAEPPASAFLLRRLLLLAVGVAVGFLLPRVLEIGHSAHDGDTGRASGSPNAIASNPKPSKGILSRVRMEKKVDPAQVTSFTSDDPHAVGDKAWQDAGGGTRGGPRRGPRRTAGGRTDVAHPPAGGRTRAPPPAAGLPINGFGRGGMQVDETVINVTQAVISLSPRVVLLRCVARRARGAGARREASACSDPARARAAKSRRRTRSTRCTSWRARGWSAAASPFRRT